MRSEVEGKVGELEQALGRCSERSRDLLAEIFRDLRWEITICEFHPTPYPPPRTALPPDLVGTP
jgi:hypothetical protein